MWSVFPYNFIDHKSKQHPKMPTEPVCPTYVEDLVQVNVVPFSCDGMIFQIFSIVA